MIQKKLDVAAPSKPFPPRCYYCEFKPFANADSYERHIVTKHVHLPAYPNIGDLELYKLTPQNMYWEKPLPHREAMNILNNYVPLSERTRHYSKQKPMSSEKTFINE